MTARRGQHAREVHPVVSLPGQITRWSRAVRGLLTRGAHAVGRGRATGQRLLDSGSSQRSAAHVGQSDPSLGNRPVRALDRGRDRDHGPGLGDPVELLVVHPPTVAELGDPNRGKNVARCQGRRQVVLEKLGRRHPTHARRAVDDHLGVESQRDRRQVAGRIGVRDRSPERPEMPHLTVADGGRCLRQQRGVRIDQRILDHLVVRGHGAHDDRVAVIANTAQFLDATEVDQQFRRRQPQPQDRNQRLPAGEHLAVVTGRTERGYRVFHRGGSHVVEG